MSPRLQLHHACRTAPRRFSLSPPLSHLFIFPFALSAPPQHKSVSSYSSFIPSLSRPSTNPLSKTIRGLLPAECILRTTVQTVSFFGSVPSTYLPPSRSPYPRLPNLHRPFRNMSSMSSVSNTEAGRNSHRVIRVATYNVLSPHLAAPDYYVNTPPEDLNPSLRLERVLHRLEKEMSAPTLDGDDVPTMLCLQEVSMDWIGPLHTFFADRGYALVSAPYGKLFNGYMGVAMAYPQTAVVPEEIRLVTLADGDGVQGCEWPWAGEKRKRPPSPRPSVFLRTLSRLQGAIGRVMRAMPMIGSGTNTDYRDKDPWAVSRSRRNVLIFGRFRLRHHDGKDGDARTFCLSTYHMPCVFWDPRVMNIHASAAVGTSQALAGNYPLILAGDFNILPDGSTYRLITTGTLPPLNPDVEGPNHIPPPYVNVEGTSVPWKSLIKGGGMDSAHFLAEGQEPTLTNYAHTRVNEEAFVGTLDYIFCSRGEKEGERDDAKDKDTDIDGVKRRQHWKNVRTLSTTMEPVEQSSGPFPNEIEPSDHILLSVELELV